MQRILIVEDDPIQCEALKSGILSHYPSWRITSAGSYQEGLNYLLESMETQDIFSIFLLDIQLENKAGDMSGFVLAEKIRSQQIYYKTPILFLTSIYNQTQFALATYHCYNYITKPYSINDILYQLEQLLFTGYLNSNTVTITDKDRLTHRIVLSDIMYIEFKSHQIEIITQQGSLITREPASSNVIQNLLKHFVQCHRKYFINPAFISSYTKTNGLLNLNQKIVPVSRTYKPTIEALLSMKQS